MSLKYHAQITNSLIETRALFYRLSYNQLRLPRGLFQEGRYKATLQRTQRSRCVLSYATFKWGIILFEALSKKMFSRENNVENLLGY